MFDQIKISNILFLDIETVSAYPEYSMLPELQKALWDKKAGYLNKENEDPEVFYQRAGIYAEFGKIVCISTGMIGVQENRRVMRIKTFCSTSEKEVLAGFSDLVTRLSQKREIDLCAHNGKEFDFPYIARRMLINGISIPLLLDTSGKKPWEIRHLDTMELWKFGDHKHYTSLELLASLFDIDSPKTDINGSEVARVFWIENDLERIANYCRNDVITVAQIMLKFKGERLISPPDIINLDNS